MNKLVAALLASRCIISTGYKVIYRTPTTRQIALFHEGNITENIGTIFVAIYEMLANIHIIRRPIFFKWKTINQIYTFVYIDRPISNFIIYFYDTCYNKRKEFQYFVCGLKNIEKNLKFNKSDGQSNIDKYI